MPREIAPLALAVNAALDRVAQAYLAERRLTADSAHALRAPLAVLDLRLQAVEAGAPPDAAALRGDVDELTRIVAALLQLARHEHGRGEVARLNLARLAREAAAAVAPALGAEGRALDVDLPVSLEIDGDPASLRDAITALLDNGRVHGRGAVRVRLAAEGREAVLAVSDEGSGPPPDAAELIFERFHKADGASPGAGLGLAIVRQVARRHGGGARFTDGATAELRLPLSRAASEGRARTEERRLPSQVDVSRATDEGA